MDTYEIDYLRCYLNSKHLDKYMEQLCREQVAKQYPDYKIEKIQIDDDDEPKCYALLYNRYGQQMVVATLLLTTAGEYEMEKNAEFMTLDVTESDVVFTDEFPRACKPTIYLKDWNMSNYMNLALKKVTVACYFRHGWMGYLNQFVTKEELSEFVLEKDFAIDWITFFRAVHLIDRKIPLNKKVVIDGLLGKSEYEVLNKVFDVTRMN